MQKICSPSTTFNCVGPGAVGTGSLAGMRVLGTLNKKFNIWPFNNSIEQKSIIAEIFQLYFRKFNCKPDKQLGYTIEIINLA